MKSKTGGWAICRAVASRLALSSLRSLANGRDGEAKVTAGCAHLDLVTYPLVQQGPAYGRFIADTALAGVDLGATDDGVVHCFPILGDDGNSGTQANPVGVVGLLLVDQFGILDDALQRQNTPLHERLLVLGVIVFGVILGAGQFLGLLNAAGDLRPSNGYQMLQLRLKLGQAFFG